LLVTTGWLSTAWTPTLHEVADGLGVVIDYHVVYETDSLDYDIATGFGTVRAGTASAVHFELQDSSMAVRSWSSSTTIWWVGTPARNGNCPMVRPKWRIASRPKAIPLTHWN
jgi:hypothetical protein